MNNDVLLRLLSVYDRVSHINYNTLGLSLWMLKVLSAGFKDGKNSNLQWPRMDKSNFQTRRCRRPAGSERSDVSFRGPQPSEFWLQVTEEHGSSLPAA